MAIKHIRHLQSHPCTQKDGCELAHEIESGQPCTFYRVSKSSNSTESPQNVPFFNYFQQNKAIVVPFATLCF